MSTARQFLTTAFLHLLLLSPPPLQASEDLDMESLFDMSLEELMEIEVTVASGTRQSLHQAPAVASVITAADIKATGATNLVDILESVPGLHIVLSPFAYRPLQSMRGTVNGHTLVLINGTPLKGMVFTNGPLWDGIPASSIARVEIIRGPGSAIYGADAMTGVINVITKSQKDIDGVEIGTRTGSFDTHTAWLESGGMVRNFEVALVAEYRTGDGYDPFIEVDEQTSLDQRFGTSASHAPGPADISRKTSTILLDISKDNWKLRTAYLNKSDYGAAFGMGDSLDYNGLLHADRYNVDLIYHNTAFIPNWEVTSELKYHHSSFETDPALAVYPPGAFLDGTYPDGMLNEFKAKESYSYITGDTIYRGIDHHALRLGAGYVKMDLYQFDHHTNFGTGPDGSAIAPGSPMVDVSGSPYALMPEEYRENYYLFAQDIWTISDAWELTCGLRFDDFSDFGSTVNPRLALVWQTASTLTSKLLYGQAFRSPSFLNLYTNTSRSSGNPDLEPETSNTLELAFSLQATPKLHFGLNLFNIRQTERISEQETPGSGTQVYQNAGTVNIHGFETEATWDVTGTLRLAGNYSYHESDNNDLTSSSSPRHDTYLRADWRFSPGWHFNSQANWIADRKRQSGDTRSPIDDYLTADATLRYTTRKQWEFAFSVRNIFDEDARESSENEKVPYDYPLAERNCYAELRFHF